ncbi:hypothetical protein CRYUN_Cryun31cG0122900 [Craigia yunnanensis]
MASWRCKTLDIVLTLMCNYLISSLGAVVKLEEAVKVLKGMGRAGCISDLESYTGFIAAMCTLRRTVDAVELMKQMAES